MSWVLRSAVLYCAVAVVALKRAATTLIRDERITRECDGRSGRDSENREREREALGNGVRDSCRRGSNGEEATGSHGRGGCAESI